MFYKALKGLTCEPYNRAITAGCEFDNNVEKLSKDLIDQAISEKKIIPVQKAAKVEKAKPKTIKKKK